MKLLVSLILLFGASFSSNTTMAQDCLPYEPATVTLKGRITRKTFAGPPNYENIKKGDTPETYWILHLRKPICVSAHEKKNVTNLQLILSEAQYVKYRNLLGKRIEVSGKLMPANTGHHHTNVLVTVTDMKADRN